tara:strand:- start:402 stop:776 length:375 start_codon:yes stop_codon:yes gene_type:complete
MGRHYWGDINGKFQWAVQSSADADFFGVKGYQPEHFFYNFKKDDLKNVKKGIEDCKKELGDYREKMDKFFKNKDSFNRMELKDFLKVDENKARDLLKWNARLHLGSEIKSCIEKKGRCDFEAEL